MKIVVNTRLLIKNNLEGIGLFTYETFKRITIQHPDHEFYFIFDRIYDEEFIFSDNITPLILAPQARHPVLHYIWFEISLSSLLNRLKPDIFVSPDGYISLGAKVNTLDVIHDLNFEHHPEYLPFTSRIYYRYFFPRYAKKATRIATVSEFSKNDIVETYNIPSSKIDIVYNGVNETYKPLDSLTKQIIKDKYTQGSDFFVFIGALNPRKNITGLLKAFDLFCEKNINFKLLIVGKKMWWNKEINQTFRELKFKDNIIFTQRLNCPEVNDVLGSATALVFPSFFEGFGIPIVEAFNCGTPVITSNLTSMPEIAGNAALLVNPYSIDSIADAMLRIVEDPDLRNDLLLKAEKRKTLFSWQKSSEALWQSIMKTVIDKY